MRWEWGVRGARIARLHSASSICAGCPPYTHKTYPLDAELRGWRMAAGAAPQAEAACSYRFLPTAVSARQTW